MYLPGLTGILIKSIFQEKMPDSTGQILYKFFNNYAIFLIFFSNYGLIL